MLFVGTRIYALGAIALALVGLAWGDFALVWQPVPAGLPGRALLAYLFAAALCGLFALVVLLLHVPRVLRHPEVYGVWSGLAEQLALVAGGWLAYQLCAAPAAGRAGAFKDGVRIFAVCLLIFGGAHFFYLQETAALVPSWLPPGQRFWAATTGLAHLMAGLALLSGVLAQLASLLVTVMFASFSALIHIKLL